MCLRRAPEKYIAGAALDRAALHSSDGCNSIVTGWYCRKEEAKRTWIWMSTPPYVYMAQCLTN
jgi:hypothetical protein